MRLKPIEFNWELKKRNPELSALVDRVFDMYKYPLYEDAKNMEYRLGSLCSDSFLTTPCSVLAYARIYTGEIHMVGGEWRIYVVPAELARLEAFMKELDGIQLNQREFSRTFGYKFDPMKSIKDVETVKGEISDILTRYHGKKWYEYSGVL